MVAVMVLQDCLKVVLVIDCTVVRPPTIFPTSNLGNELEENLADISRLQWILINFIPNVNMIQVKLTPMDGFRQTTMEKYPRRFPVENVKNGVLTVLTRTMPPPWEIKVNTARWTIIFVEIVEAIVVLGATPPTQI